MKKRYLLLAAGFLLLIFSAPPVFAMVQEWKYQTWVSNHFDIKRVDVNFMELNSVEVLGRGQPIPIDKITLRNHLSTDGDTYEPLTSIDDYNEKVMQLKDKAAFVHYAREYLWNGHTVWIEDVTSPEPFEAFSDNRYETDIIVKINGRDMSSSSSIEVRPGYVDDNRYHGYVGLLLVEEDGEEKLVFIERTSGFWDYRKESLVWRTLVIKQDGEVKEERFAYHNRSKRPEHVNYINLTSTPIALGYKSNVLMGWPSIFFPLLYPFVSAAIGFIFIAIAGLFILLNKRLVDK